MNLLPVDLGQRRYGTILAERAHAAMAGSRRGPIGGSPPPKPSRPGQKERLGALGRLWTQGTGLDPDTARIGLEATRPLTTGMMVGLVGGSTGFLAPTLVGLASSQPTVAVVFGTLWFMMASVGLSVPAIQFRRINNRPLSANELDSLMPASADDPLERAYLSLVRDAIRQSIPADAEDEVRAAIRTLGEALDRLPPATSPASLDVPALRDEAAAARAKAVTEPDPVISDSLTRRADALTRSADAADRSQLLMRRSQALREEMAAQTESLRLGLSAFYTGATDVATLSRLADSVRGVASEAGSVAAAREELDGAAPRSAILDLRH